jgi:hypothetical protein
VNLDSFMQANGLPAEYGDSARRCDLPFCEWLADQVAGKVGETCVGGMGGARGTG